MSAARERQSGPRESGQSWKRWVAAIAALLALILIVQNSQEVDVEFIFATITAPLIFALLIVAALGFVVGYLVAGLRRRRHERG